MASVKIDSPVSTPASEWATQTTSAIHTSAAQVVPPQNLNSALPTTTTTTVTTPGVDVPGAFPGGLPKESQPLEQLTAPDISQHVQTAKEYVSNVDVGQQVQAAREYVSGVDVSQHVETARQYLPAKEDVQATLASVHETAKQYLPERVANALGAVFPTTSTDPNVVSTDLDTTSGAKPSSFVDASGTTIPSEGGALATPRAEDAALLDPTSTTAPAERITDSTGEPAPIGVSVADSHIPAQVPLPPSQAAVPTIGSINSSSSFSSSQQNHDMNGTQTPSSTRVNAPESEATTPAASFTANEPAPSFDGAQQAQQGLGPGVEVAPTPPAKDVDMELRSASSDAAIPAGSDDKLGGPPNRSESNDFNESNDASPGKEKKGAAKLLGKVKSKLTKGN